MEEIEVLDLDEEKPSLKKKTTSKKKSESKKNENKPEIQKEKNESKNKEKKKLTKKEKIFIFCNIAIILGIIGFYAYRTIYYYKQTHDIKDNITLKEKLTSVDNIVYQKDGLYEKDGIYYYKGEEVNNYLFYAGRMFRIIGIDNGIKVIEDDILTNLVSGINNPYEESTLHKWLDKYLNTFKDYELFLKENSFCNESINIDNYDCKTKNNYYVGLLDIKEYLNAGGKNSYLNNNSYYWTINYNDNNQFFYVNDEGNINNINNKEENYYSYGIRPVITLNENVSYIGGSGIINDPFMIEENDNALLKDNSIGSYVKYQDYTFRIIDIDDKGISLIMDGVLDKELAYNDVLKYLNNDFIKELNKDDLVKRDYIINEYNYNNKYDYEKAISNNNNYITIPNVGDLYLNDYQNYWLNTISDNKLGLYYTVDDNMMFFGDLKSNKHKIRPIIKLKNDMIVTDGNGTKDNPLIVGDSNVEEN